MCPASWKLTILLKKEKSRGKEEKIDLKQKWHPHGDSNPGYQDENLVS